MLGDKFVFWSNHVSDCVVSSYLIFKKKFMKWRVKYKNTCPTRLLPKLHASS